MLDWLRFLVSSIDTFLFDAPVILDTFASLSAGSVKNLAESFPVILNEVKNLAESSR